VPVHNSAEAAEARRLLGKPAASEAVGTASEQDALVSVIIAPSDKTRLDNAGILSDPESSPLPILATCRKTSARPDAFTSSPLIGARLKPSIYLPNSMSKVGAACRRMSARPRTSSGSPPTKGTRAQCALRAYC
jgi:hypothetical protein